MKYNVRLHYSTYLEKEVEADSREEAVLKARKEQDIFYDQQGFESAYAEALHNLEPWKDADMAEEVT
jgi:hypothetical protein